MSSSQNENVNNKEYSVVELVNRLKSATESKIGAKKVSFEVSVSNTVSSKLIGDINKVQKVLLNVLNNAAKYTDIGKIKLDIGATNEKNIQTLNFVILDTGCGIKDEEQEHIYEDGSDDKKGVGLAVSKRYIEKERVNKPSSTKRKRKNYGLVYRGIVFSGSKESRRYKNKGGKQGVPKTRTCFCYFLF